MKDGVSISNFQFLAPGEPIFFQLAHAAERVFSFDPNTTLVKLRQFGEAIAQSMAARIGIAFDERTSQADLLFLINRRIGLEAIIRELFHTLRIEGNKAAHEFETSHKQALDGLKVARQLAIWYHRAFGGAGAAFKPSPFHTPDDPAEGLRELQAEISRLQNVLGETRRKHEGEHQLLELKAKEAEEFAAVARQMDEERAIYEQLATEAEAELVRT